MTNFESIICVLLSQIVSQISIRATIHRMLIIFQALFSKHNFISSSLSLCELLSSPPFYRQRNGGWGNLSALAQMAQLASSRVGILSALQRSTAEQPFFLFIAHLPLFCPATRASGISWCGLANWVYVQDKGSLYYKLKIYPVKETWILSSQAVVIPELPWHCLRA